MREWFKENWYHVLSLGLTFIIGLIIGRNRRGSASQDFAELQASNKQLEARLRELQSTAITLRDANAEHRDELEQLEIKLSEARRAASIARAELDGSAEGVDSLERTNSELERFLQRYGAELGRLENSINSDGG